MEFFSKREALIFFLQILAKLCPPFRCGLPNFYCSFTSHCRGARSKQYIISIVSQPIVFYSTTQSRAQGYRRQNGVLSGQKSKSSQAKLYSLATENCRGLFTKHYTSHQCSSAQRLLTVFPSFLFFCRQFHSFYFIILRENCARIAHMLCVLDVIQCLATSVPLPHTITTTMLGYYIHFAALLCSIRV